MPPEAYEELPLFDKFRIPDCQPSQARSDGTWLVRKLKTRHPGHGNGYVIRIADESMQPRIEPGDLILVDYAGRPRSGNIVIATFNGRAVVKRYFRRKGRVVLRSMNPRHPDIEVKETDQLEVGGVALRIVDGAL
jgi:phage repressor protein C with HTH and peptisase S24 domain